MPGKNKFRVWETALLLALSAAMLCSSWASAASGRVSDQLVRLHVIASSDSEYDQAVKLRVRDAVLEYLEPRLSEAPDSLRAGEIISSGLEGIRAAALSASEGQAVSVELGEEYYPTREYDTFSLPAGKYTSLRVTLGGGEGHNWWCVVFPPLCLTASDAEDAFAALDGDTRAVISEDGAGVQFKFRLLELWGELRSLLGI